MPPRPIRVRAIATQPGHITRPQVQAMLAGASLVYAVVDIGFELSAFEEAFGEGLEIDGEIGPLPLQLELNRTRRAVQYPGELVIFFRLISGAYSSSWGEYVIMSSVDINSFAHEIGHYLHLSHTHPDSLTNAIYEAGRVNYESAVAVAIDAVRNAGGLDAFDGDYPAIRDTPPDPGPPLFQRSGYDAAGNANNPTEHCSGTVSLNVDGTIYDVRPDRSNVMSYYLSCTARATLSVDQRDRVRTALTLGNRRHLLDGVFPEAPAVLKDARQNGHVFARGDDYNVWRAVREGDLWSGWRNDVGAGILASGPAAVETGDGAVHIFSVGTDLDLWHSFLAGSTWSGWRDDMGDGILTSAPAAVVTQDGAIHLFARGDDRNIWHNFWNGNTWSGWRDDLGAGQLTSGPDAIVTVDGHIHVFARGSDMNVWHSFWDGVIWSGWRDDCGVGQLTSPPGAIVSEDGAIHLFARGTDRQAWHTFWNGATWRGWLQDLPQSTFLSGFAPSIEADGVIALHAYGDDRQVKVSRWNGSHWSGWRNLVEGGTFQP